MLKKTILQYLKRMKRSEKVDIQSHNIKKFN